MPVRTVYCTDGPPRQTSIIVTAARDILEHISDTSYEACFIGVNPDAKSKYLIRCKDLSVVPKDFEAIFQLLSEAIRRVPERRSAEEIGHTEITYERVPIEDEIESSIGYVAAGVVDAA